MPPLPMAKAVPDQFALLTADRSARDPKDEPPVFVQDKLPVLVMVQSPEIATLTHCVPSPTRTFPAVAVVVPKAAPLILPTVVATVPAVLVTSPDSAGICVEPTLPEISVKAGCDEDGTPLVDIELSHWCVVAA